MHLPIKSRCSLGNSIWYGTITSFPWNGSFKIHWHYLNRRIVGLILIWFFYLWSWFFLVYCECYGRIAIFTRRTEVPFFVWREKKGKGQFHSVWFGLMLRNGHVSHFKTRFVLVPLFSLLSLSLYPSFSSLKMTEMKLDLAQFYYRLVFNKNKNEIGPATVQWA